VQDSDVEGSTRPLGSDAEAYAIRGKDRRPELLLRKALYAAGARGWWCHWKAPGGRIDVAFTRWRMAVFEDGFFWHGHPSKWQPGRWSGYWDQKIKRNIIRDRRQGEAIGDDRVGRAATPLAGPARSRAVLFVAGALPQRGEAGCCFQS
jgi:DNA mismatch endonuclease Vsr